MALSRTELKQKWREASVRYRARLRADVDALLPPEPCFRCKVYGEATELAHILETLSDVGFDLRCQTLRELDVSAALAGFREHLGGELCITLLSAIGQGVEVDEIDVELMSKCIDDLVLGYGLPIPREPESAPC